MKGVASYIRASYQKRRPRWTGLKWLGIAFVIAGIGTAVLLAFVGNAKEPPSASAQALIAFFSIVAQVGAALAFSREGKADPAHAHRSVSRLLTLLGRAEEARVLAEFLYEERIAITQMRLGNGQLSTHLSYLEEGFSEAVEDWRAFDPKAVDRAISNRPVETMDGSTSDERG